MSSMLKALNRPVVAIVAVGILAAGIRFVNLDHPEHRVFDEYYYPKSACIFLGYPNERCGINSEDERFWRENENDTGAWVHPPLGKWAIALGELAAGTRSLGWRFSSAVAGTATVVALAVIVQLLWGSALWTFVGGLLLATENLNVILSRTGILDIFVTFWIVLGFLFLLLDRRWVQARAPDPPPDEEPDAEARPRLYEPLWRPWRFAAGVAFGASFATKWSGATGLAAALILAVVWEVGRRRNAGVRHPIRRTLAVESFGLVLAFMALPVAVYLASYLGWFLHFGFDFNTWATKQRLAFDFQAGLRAAEESNPYQSPSWQWLLLWRPVLFYRVNGPDFVQAIYANGNPAIFWGSILAIPYTAYSWFRRREWQAGFILVTVLGLYLPWFLSTHPEYLFYAGPLSPFLVLAVVYGLRSMSEWVVQTGEKRTRPLLPVVVVSVAIAVGLFVFFWPTLTGGRLSTDAYALRTWFSTWV